MSCFCAWTWFRSLWKWFAEGLWKDLDILAKETLEFGKPSLVGGSGWNSEDHNADRNAESKSILLALPVETKLFLVGLMDRYEEKGICQIAGYITGTRRCVNLPKRGNYIWSHHLIKLKVIHCHSPGSIRLLHRPNRKVKQRCGRNRYPCIFLRSLMAALISAIPPGM